MKTKRLQMRDNSSMFALLCVFIPAHINAHNKVIGAARYYDFYDTSGASLNDAVGYPNLLRPRSYFLGIGGWDNWDSRNGL
jgi:hypothetical protein